MLSVTSNGVLNNDIDPDANQLTTIVMTQPLHGSLHMNANGNFTYLPDSNYAGLDSFQYTAIDGAAASNIATVTIDVGATNTAPIAQDDSYSTPAGAILSIAGPGLLSNDSAPDGNQPLRVVLVSQPLHGVLALNTGGGFNYIPNNQGQHSSDIIDSFTYYANDSVVNSNQATVTIHINSSTSQPIPTLSNWMILILTSLIAFIGLFRLHNSGYKIRVT